MILIITLVSLSMNQTLSAVETGTSTAFKTDIQSMPGLVLIPNGSEWQYLDNGTDQGTLWRQPGFDTNSDTTLHIGVFGYESSEYTVEVVNCNAENNYSDLFAAIPNSYGTLGYILKLCAKTMPVKPYVKLQHVRYRDTGEYFDAVKEACQSDVDFVDGSIFSDQEMYLSLGRFTDTAPYTSDYTWLKMYFRSIQQRSEDFLTIRDYIRRWDTDWFWCSRNLFVQNLPM